nr:reverse transcriptase domain-containing protein [Tanacetum cinerariifolium]
MHTLSSSNLIVGSFTIPKRRNRRRSKQIVEPGLRTIVETPVATMMDTRTMSKLIQAPTEGYGDVIVLPAILAENFELKVGLLALVTSSQFHGFERDDPHSHIRWFNKITSTLKYKNVPHEAIKLMLFPFSLEGAARIWHEKEPPHALTIIENKSKVCTSRNKPVVSKANATTSSFTPAYLPEITALTDVVKAMLLQNKTPSPASVKSMEEICVLVETTMMNQNNELKNIMSSFFQMHSPSGSGSLPSNTIADPRDDLKFITTRSGISYDGPTIPPTFSPLSKEVKREPEATKDKVQTTSSRSTAHIQPSIVQVSISEPNVAPNPNPKPSIPYPSRLNDQKLREKANSQMFKFLQIFQRLHFDISFVGALLHMPKFASTFKTFAPELTPTRMTLELANRSIAYPVGVAEDVFVKFGKFHFLADFVVVDYDVDPRVPLILGRPFLRTARALIDVHDPIIITSSPSLTPFGGGDFILEEIEACLTSDLIPLGIDDADFDSKGDILLLEKLLNDDPSSPLPPKELHFE